MVTRLIYEIDHVHTLQIDGQQISWEHLEHLYHHHQGDGQRPGSGLSVIPKIKREHVKLTSFSKMRVDLAAQVLYINFYPATHTVIISC